MNPEFKRCQSKVRALQILRVSWPCMHFTCRWTVKLFCNDLLKSRHLFFFFKILLMYFLYRGEGREEERERSISAWLPLLWLTLPTTQACALIGNSPVCEPATLWFADWCSIHGVIPARVKKKEPDILFSLTVQKLEGKKKERSCFVNYVLDISLLQWWALGYNV